MADVTPNYDLERQRIELEKSQLMLNIQSQTYRIAQMHDEESRIQDNITATKKAIAELDATLAGLTTKKE